MVRRTLRWLGYVVAALLSLFLIATVWIGFASSGAIGRSHEAMVERLARPTPAQMIDAPRQARVLGCFGCHGEGLRGDLMLDIPNVLKLWAPNLTEVAARSTDQQLAAAIRQGIGVDGRSLWIMPSPMYSHLADHEVAALIAVIRSQPRGGAPTPAIALGPFGRVGIATGRLRPATDLIPEFRARPPLDIGREMAAGRHIAAVNCTECHGSDLGGGVAGNGIETPDLAIAGAYDLTQFRALMRTGRAPHGRDLGLMRTVAQRDFIHMTDQEISDLYLYLRARAERAPG